MDNSKGIAFLDTETGLRIVDDKALFKRTQVIDPHFLSNLATKRLETSHERMGDMHHVASIPTVVIEKWIAEGFNIFDKNVTAQDILKRLQGQDMTGLMATSKNII